MVLAGATIAGNGPNKHLVIGTIRESLAEWLAEELGWLTHSIRERRYEADRQPEYRIRTHAHSALSQYAKWTESDRAPPVDVPISSHTGRIWYALAGGLQWSHEYDSGRTAAFSALSDDRAAWIGQVLTDAEPAFQGTRAGTRVQFRPLETDRWLAWIGDPVPGVAYKWADGRAEYERLRDWE
ncbi:hypothetical protein [Saliphagus sp. LR7]|uniref:hypothetical protein n=1 Tax=Saliphagus sp. LR7 TaxID=2282654 RepID=UPI000DF8250F|nr:hypothetical protein [Saliphagus sp. LR7]